EELEPLLVVADGLLQHRLTDDGPLLRQQPDALAGGCRAGRGSGLGTRHRPLIGERNHRDDSAVARLDDDDVVIDHDELVAAEAWIDVDNVERDVIEADRAWHDRPNRYRQ